MSPEEHFKLLKSAAWAAARRRVIARDKKRCKRCLMLHSESKLEVHHDPEVDETTTRAQFFDLKRLFTLCKSCHGWITSQSIEPLPRKPDSPVDAQGNITQEWINWSDLCKRRRATLRETGGASR